MKQCQKCFNTKPLEDFSKKSKNKDGLRTWCRTCCNSPENVKYRYDLKHRDRCSEKRRFRYKNDVEFRIKSDQRSANYQKKRKKEDPNFKLAGNLRTRLLRSISTESKAGSAVRDLGCSIAELKLYLESKFQAGMTWENHGRKGWHIDHVIPLSKFNLSNREDLLKACHYSNLQPMWAIDNIRKSNSVAD